MFSLEIFVWDLEARKSTTNGSIAAGQIQIACPRGGLATFAGVVERRFVMDEPPQKPLRKISFIVHATRGVIRDQNARRKTMLILLFVAVALLFSGSTFLAPALNPRQHFGRALLFWFGCVWLTLTALLLALLDLLLVRAQARKAERMLQEDFSPGCDLPSPTGRDGE